MKGRMRLSLGFAFAALIATGSAAGAQTITFDNLTVDNGDAFSSYTESGYTVDLVGGSICAAQIYGNPVPDLFGGWDCNRQETSSVLRIMKGGGGSFTFLGTELGSENGSSTYTFEGYLSGISQYSVSDVFSIAGFVWYDSQKSGVEIDELRIILNSLDEYTISYNIDNIKLGSAPVTTPEPSTLLLLSTGLGSLVYIGRRRRA